MNKLKITTGEWWSCCAETTPHFVFAGEDRCVCAMFSNEKEDSHHEPLEGIVTMEERRSNAKLITDAGNTYQQCGLLPSELLEQREKMIECLNVLQTYIRLVGVNKSLRISLIYKKITELLDSIEKQEAEQ